MDLEKITNPKFVKELSEDQLELLATDIRNFLIENISKTGGHLSSNLGIVEITMALHYVFDSPTDKILFDVGHQSYVHKILTGRAKQFSTLRKYGGLSGFQKMYESKHDVYEAGHSSTALSSAIGMAIARDLDHQDYDVIAVIGDAAMVSGETLEALNHLGSMNHKVIIVLNDNNMAIGKSVGGISNMLSDLRLNPKYLNLKEDYRSFLSKSTLGKRVFRVSKRLKDAVKKGVIEDSIFKEFGVEYIGSIDGHDIKELIQAFQVAKSLNESVILHVTTKKGKGFSLAENDTTGKWHGTPPFYIPSGRFLEKKKKNYQSWSKIISRHMEKWMQADQDIVAITPAMIYGSSMHNLFKQYPSRCFDVGIAEEHAMTLVAGLSLGKKKPFLSVYSSFMQRAYDQINHDIARMNLPCLICIDRAGIVGSDGPTHHGVFDIGFLTNIPNIVLFAPSNALEAKQYINTVLKHFDHPYFIRIPKNDVIDQEVALQDNLVIGSWKEENDIDYELVVITYGDHVDDLKEFILKENLPVRLINARFIKPMDETMLNKYGHDNKPMLVYETDLKINSLASQISYYYATNHIYKDFYSIAIDDHYSTQGSISEILEEEHVSFHDVKTKIKELLNHEGEN